jgi:hypothetical protein
MLTWMWVNKCILICSHVFTNRMHTWVWVRRAMGTKSHGYEKPEKRLCYNTYIHEVYIREEVTSACNRVYSLCYVHVYLRPQWPELSCMLDVSDCLCSAQWYLYQTRGRCLSHWLHKGYVYAWRNCLDTRDNILVFNKSSVTVTVTVVHAYVHSIHAYIQMGR